jgi:hypothetical protein
MYEPSGARFFFRGGQTEDIMHHLGLRIELLPPSAPESFPGTSRQCATWDSARAGDPLANQPGR